MPWTTWGSPGAAADAPMVSAPRHDRGDGHVCARVRPSVPTRSPPARRGVPGGLCRLWRRGHPALRGLSPGAVGEAGHPIGRAARAPVHRSVAAAPARVVRTVRGRRAECAPRAQVRGRAPAGGSARGRDRGALGGGRGRRRPARSRPDSRGAATTPRLRPGGPARRRCRGGPGNPYGGGAGSGPRDAAAVRAWARAPRRGTWRTRSGCMTGRAGPWPGAGSCSWTTWPPPAPRSSHARTRSWRRALQASRPVRSPGRRDGRRGVEGPGIYSDHACRSLAPLLASRAARHPGGQP